MPLFASAIVCRACWWRRTPSSVTHSSSFWNVLLTLLAQLEESPDAEEPAGASLATAASPEVALPLSPPPPQATTSIAATAVALHRPRARRRASIPVFFISVSCVLLTSSGPVAIDQPAPRSTPSARGGQRTPPHEPPTRALTERHG